MRHVVGYFCCLGFLSGVLIYLGVFQGLVRSSQATVRDIITVLGLDPEVGPTVKYAFHVGGVALSPAVALGHLAAIVFSTVGLLALILYFLLSWMMPAR
jgi:hypothetical protein